MTFRRQSGHSMYGYSIVMLNLSMFISAYAALTCSKASCCPIHADSRVISASQATPKDVPEHSRVYNYKGRAKYNTVESKTYEHVADCFPSH